MCSCLPRGPAALLKKDSSSGNLRTRGSGGRVTECSEGPGGCQAWPPPHPDQRSKQGAVLCSGGSKQLGEPASRPSCLPLEGSAIRTGASVPTSPRHNDAARSRKVGILSAGQWLRTPTRSLPQGVHSLMAAQGTGSHEGCPENHIPLFKILSL